nr:uncharacterized protein LOC112492817 [Ziziphus jujuba var. spinosa]
MGSSSTTREDKGLFRVAMEGDWEEVVKIYEKYPDARRAKITRSGATALHVAVTEGKVEIVEKLIKVIISQDDKEVLRAQNEGGYTVLHLAASVGNEEMCKIITDADSSMIAIRTKSKETPLFSAALHGKNEVFCFLDSISTCSESHRQHRLSYGRREDGNTVLHSAIDGEYFDLAYRIIDLYEDFVNYVNDEGFTPLHLLATKSSAFKSGINFGRFKTFIYECIYVEETPPHLGSTDKKNFVQNVQTNRNEQDRTTSTDLENPTLPSKRLTHGDDHIFPANYVICVEYLKLVCKIMLLLVCGQAWMMSFLNEIRDLKKKHIWSAKIMDKLLYHTSIYDKLEGGTDRGNLEYDSGEIKPGRNNPEQEAEEESSASAKNKKKDKGSEEEKWKKDPEMTNETVLLTAARYGVTEIVERILDKFPTAIQDTDIAKKNILILTVENRQPSVYNLLRNKKMLSEGIIRKVDHEHNSVLHVAAIYDKDMKPWPIPGIALQMQWEIKWFEFVKDSMPKGIFVRRNLKGKTPDEVFTETHQTLIKESSKWLIKTSESCSVVAALIAGVAFATSASVPGGNNEETGKPYFATNPAFQMFAMTSLIALCFSVTSLVMFMTIITSRFQENDFARDLPCKLLMGLTSLFVAIGCMLVSFCAGHFLVLENNLKFASFPVYAMTCLPVSIFAAAQFPLYVDLLQSTIKNPFKHRHRYKFTKTET